MTISGSYPAYFQTASPLNPVHFRKSYSPLKFGYAEALAGASPMVDTFSPGQLILSMADMQTLKKQYSSGGVASKYPIGALMDMYRVKLANPNKPDFSLQDILNESTSTSDSEWEIRAMGRALNALAHTTQPLVVSPIEGQYRLTPKGQRLAQAMKQKTLPEQQALLRSDNGILRALDNLVNAQVISVQENFLDMSL